jgi:hypothetical protein
MFHTFKTNSQLIAACLDAHKISLAIDHKLNRMFVNYPDKVEFIKMNNNTILSTDIYGVKRVQDAFSSVKQGENGKLLHETFF